MNKALLLISFCSSSLLAQSTLNGVPNQAYTLADTRPTAVSMLKNVTVPLSGTQTLLSVTGAGTVTYIHFDMVPVADALTVERNSTLTFNCGTAPQVIPLRFFLWTQDSPPVFWGNNINLGSNSAGLFQTGRPLQINYSAGCTITFTNASTTQGVNLYMEITYRIGTPTAYPANRGVWYAWHTAPTAVTNFSFLNLFPSVVYYGGFPSNVVPSGGELESTTFWYNSSVDNTYLDGHPFVYADGNVAITASGAEDFFGGTGYFAAQPIGFSDHWGHVINNNFLTPVGTADTLAYRFFGGSGSALQTGPDQVIFNNSLWVKAQNSEIGFGPPGTINIGGLVTFWAANNTLPTPIASVPAGSYTSTSQSVSLYELFPNTTICYTVNGTTPAATTPGTCSVGTTYSTAITVSSSQTIKAIATAVGATNSAVLSNAYTISGTGPALVAHKALSTAVFGSNNTITTSATSTTGANFEIAFCAAAPQATPDCTVSDSLVNTWVPGPTRQLTNGVTGQFFYVFNPTVSGTQTFSANGRNQSLFVAAFSGVPTAVIYDLTTQAGSASTTTFQPGSITPSINGELLISMVGTGSTGAPTVNSSYTITDTLNASGGQQVGGAMAYQVQTSSAAINPTWTLTGADTVVALQVGIF